jgi:hypothetical protein
MQYDLTGLAPELRERVARVTREQHEAQVVKAERRQRAIAEWHHRNPGRETPLGRQEMAVDAYVDRFWKRKRGRDVWADDDFRKWFMKTNPAVVVKSGSAKIMTGYTGAGAGFEVTGYGRYRKVYK